jgi:hypothetical protein
LNVPKFATYSLPFLGVLTIDQSLKCQTVVLAQSFSPNLTQDGQQTCRPAANFSMTKMQEENSIIQSPCFFELADKLFAHLVPN